MKITCRKVEEVILRACCRNPRKKKHVWPSPNLDTALTLLKEQFPDFLLSIAGRKVLDFGCGPGAQAVALGMAGAKEVVGVDINTKHFAGAYDMARRSGVTERVAFLEPSRLADLGLFDVVLSCNSMEHFRDPDVVLREMASHLAPHGRLYVSFGPPWYSLYGAHTAFFCKVPWIHLIFSEDAVMSVRAKFVNDGATRYEEVRWGLNKMSLARFERLVADVGLEVEYHKHYYVLGLTFLEKIPFLRELLIYHIGVILRLRTSLRSSA